MKKKFIAITGPTSGIGRETAMSLGNQGNHLLLFSRNEAKLKDLSKELKAQGVKDVDYFNCDLASIQSIRRASNEFYSKFDTIDVLINNAGGIIPEKRFSAEDYEYTFAMNHLGHFYLTNLLKPALAKSEAPRVISVSSVAHQMGNLNFKDLARRNKGYSGFKVYADAKLCNIYFTKELARRWSDINVQAHCLHPGVVKTGFASEYKGLMGLLVKLGAAFMISAEKGADTSIFLASTDKLDQYENGSYFIKRKVKSPTKLAQSKAKASQFWEYSLELLHKVGVQVNEFS